MLPTSDSNHQTILKCVSYTFLKNFLIFNWRIIVLQRCAGFCHRTGINHQYTYFTPALEPPPTLHHSKLSQSTRLSSLHHTANPHRLSILHSVMCVCQRRSLNASLSPLPLRCPQVCSLCLRLYSCTANRFISAIFLDSICMC